MAWLYLDLLVPSRTVGINFEKSYSTATCVVYLHQFSLNIFIHSELGNKFCNLIPFHFADANATCSGTTLLYKGIYNVQEIWLSLNTGQSFIVPFRRTIIVFSRPYSQMVSRESQTVPYIFIPEWESNQDPLC